jgi:hypothetical protein
VIFWRKLKQFLEGSKMKVFLVVVCLMAVANMALAENIRGIELDFAAIGNAGNSADTTGYGAVSHNYRIGTKEITANQWQTIDTAAGIGGSGYWSGNQPAASISWYDAARFCNYLTSGNKYSGAYNFDQSGNFLGIDRNSAVSSYGTVYVIPTEDEWYKAAYYTGSSYSLYANGQNTIPAADNGWNYDGGLYSDPWNVGAGTPEQNGTFDMMGNVWEWNETLIGSNRGVRGGSYGCYDYQLISSYRYDADPFYQSVVGGLGFRVASIPEPATLLLLGLGGMFLRKRKM